MATYRERHEMLPDPKPQGGLWGAYQPDGKLIFDGYGVGVCFTKKLAMRRAREDAELIDELASGDTNRYEGQTMPWAEVNRRGYRVRMVTVTPGDPF